MEMLLQGDVLPGISKAVLLIQGGEAVPGRRSGSRAEELFQGG